MQDGKLPLHLAAENVDHRVPEAEAIFKALTTAYPHAKKEKTNVRGTLPRATRARSWPVCARLLARVVSRVAPPLRAEWGTTCQLGRKADFS